MRRTFEQELSDKQVAWFQDNRSGCEKQTIYFERMRYLQSELITVEQKNLINAMERLKPLTYPRRKPVVLHCSRQRKHARNDLKAKSIAQAQRHSPADRSEDHHYHIRRGENLGQNKNADVLPLNPTPVVVSIENKRNNNERLGEKNLVRHRLSGKSKELVQAQPTVREGSKWLIHLMETDARTPLSRVLFPSLPCIPNVGHRTHIEQENQFKILEIAHGEFQTCRLSVQSNVSQGRNIGLTTKERKHGNCTRQGSRATVPCSADGDVPTKSRPTKCENETKSENNRKRENNRTKRENNRTKRENGIKCENNDTKCEKNGKESENDDTNCENNETERKNSATECEMCKTESTSRNVKSRTKIEVECPRQCKDPDERIVPPPTRANSGSKSKASEECSPSKVTLNFTLQS